MPITDDWQKLSGGVEVHFGKHDWKADDVVTFRGHSGFDERKQMGSLGFRTKRAVWGFYLKHCNAIGIRSPERLMVENCHATGMSAECFYSGSKSRHGNNEPSSYTKAIT